MKRDLPSEGREWLMKRNCSLTPRQMCYAYGLMCVMSFAVASGFLMKGMWQILLFTMLEMTAVAAAFLHYARHATDYERLVLQGGLLRIEKVSGSKVEQYQLELYHLHLQAPRRYGELIHLRSRGVQVDVGYFTPDPKRRALASELRHELGLH